MLEAAVAILCLLASQANGLITSAAKCLAGFEWMFSSINQSPCDVTEELLAVCVTRYHLRPLSNRRRNSTYPGLTRDQAAVCSCSTVVYSLMNACAICQNHDGRRWSLWHGNCTTVSVAAYSPQIPDGVKVPAYAYQNVTVSDTFNVSLAQSMSGPESTRLPFSSTASSPISSSTTNGSTISSSAASGTGGSVNNTPALIGGVIGGIVAVGLIGALITYLVVHPRQKLSYDSNIQKSPFTDTTFSSTILPPGTPGMNANDRNSYPYTDPNMMYYSHDRQHSPPYQNMTRSSTDLNAHNYPPQRMPQSTYAGMPELY